ncbi:MAG: vWA domain-containing protein [Candidatus Heimdallarchaeaceae archaeon]
MIKQNTDYVAGAEPTSTESNKLSIQMLANVTSHRTDGIISALPGSSIAVKFNITNISNTSISSLTAYPVLSNYGDLRKDFNSTKDILTPSESWLTTEYIIDILPVYGGVPSPCDLVIVLDQSGSMGDEIEALAKDLDDVLGRMDKVIPDLQVGLILFGSTKSPNPYSNPENVFDLTSNISYIRSILNNTKAAGSYEPWGDALWVAENRISWRETSVKIIVLITDEPCDSGQIVGFGETETDYNGPLLYELIDNISRDKIHLCTIAALGSDELTINQLSTAANMADGTFIEIGNSKYTTSDLVQIIAELVQKYACERELKIVLEVSYKTVDNIDNCEFQRFVILIDDLPPEISINVYKTSDFNTDEHYLNIYLDVKDVTGLKFAEVYYKFDDDIYWITANTTALDVDTYYLSIRYEPYFHKMFYYQIYVTDWLGNSNLTEIFKFDLSEPIDTLYSDSSLNVRLNAFQKYEAMIYGSSDHESFGIITLEDRLFNNVEVKAYDLNNSASLELFNTSIGYSFNVNSNHQVIVIVKAFDECSFNLFNTIVNNLQFGDNITRHVDWDTALLYSLVNLDNDSDIKSVLADSEVVSTYLILFSQSNWSYISSAVSEIMIPQGAFYLLITPIYHEGEIFISYNYETVNTPHTHYYIETKGALINLSFILLTLLSVALLSLWFRKTKR